MSDAAAEKPAEAKPAGGNKLLLIVVLVFNVLIAGGLGYMMMANRGAAEKPKAAAHGEAEGEGEGHGEGHEEKAEEEGEEEGESEGHGAKGAFGPLLEVGTFVTNLAPAAPNQPGRYAKVTLHVEATNEAAKAKVEGALVPIRSEALMFLSNSKPDELVGEEKIKVLQAELLKRINALVGKKAVKRVFFAELVVQ